MRFRSLLVAAVLPVASIAAAQPSQELQVRLDPVLVSYVHSRTSISRDLESKLTRDDQVQRTRGLWLFWAAYLDNLKVASAELERRAHEARQEVRQRHKSPSAAPDGGVAGPVYGSGACGGDLPSCYVLNRESRGNIRAENPTSTASGKWQILDSTWNGFMGYSHAADAPEWVQDAKARTLGACNWNPPSYCAG